MQKHYQVLICRMPITYLRNLYISNSSCNFLINKKTNFEIQPTSGLFELRLIKETLHRGYRIYLFDKSRLTGGTIMRVSRTVFLINVPTFLI